MLPRKQLRRSVGDGSVNFPMAFGWQYLPLDRLNARVSFYMKPKKKTQEGYLDQNTLFEECCSAQVQPMMPRAEAPRKSNKSLNAKLGSAFLWRSLGESESLANYSFSQNKRIFHRIYENQ